MKKFTVIGIVIVICSVSFVTSVDNAESKSVAPDPNDQEQPEGSGKDGENAKRHLRYLYGDAYNDYFEEDMLGPYAKSFWNKYYDFIPQHQTFDTFNVPLDHYEPKCGEELFVVNPKPQPPKKPLKDILRLDESLPCQDPKPSKKPLSSQKGGSEYRDNLLKHVLKIVNFVQDKQTKEYGKKSSKKPKNKTKNEKPPCDSIQELKKIVECGETPKCDLPCIGVSVDGKTVSKIPPNGLVPIPCEENANGSPECEEKTYKDLKKVLEIVKNCEEEEEKSCEDKKPAPKSKPPATSTPPPPVVHKQKEQPHSSPKVLIEKLVLVNGQLPTQQQQPMNQVSNDLYNSIMTIINSYTQNGMPRGGQGHPGGGSSGGLLPGVSGTVGNLLGNVNGVVTGGGNGGQGGLLPGLSGTVGGLLGNVNGVVTGGGKGGNSGGLLPGLSGTVGDLIGDVNGVVTGGANGGQGGLLPGLSGTVGGLLGNVNGVVTGGGKGGNSGGLLPGLSGTVGDLLGDVNGVVTGGANGGQGGLLPGLSGTVGGLLGNVNGVVTGGGKGGNSGGLLPGLSGTVGDLIGDVNGVVTGGANGGQGGLLPGLSGTVGGLLGNVNGVVTGGGKGGNSGGLLPGLSGTVGDLLGNVNGVVTGEGGKGGKGGKGGNSDGLLPGLSGTVGDLLGDVNGLLTGQGSNDQGGGRNGGLLPDLSGTVGDLLGNVNGLLTGEGDNGGRGGKGSGGKGPSGGLLPGVSDTVGGLVGDLNGALTGEGEGKGKGSNGGLLPGVSGTVGNLLGNVNGLLTGDEGKGKGGGGGWKGGSKGGNGGQNGLLPGLSNTVGDLVNNVNGVLTGDNGGKGQGGAKGNGGEKGDDHRNKGKDQSKPKPKSDGGLLPGVSDTVGGLLDNVNGLLTGQGKKSEKDGGGGGGGLLGLTSELVPKTIENPSQKQIIADINNSDYPPIETMPTDVNHSANPPIEIVQPIIDSNIQEIFSTKIESTNTKPVTDSNISQISDASKEKTNEIQRAQDDVAFFAEQSEVVSQLSQNIPNIPQNSVKPVPKINFEERNEEFQAKHAVIENRPIAENTESQTPTENIQQPIGESSGETSKNLGIDSSPTSQLQDDFAGAETIVKPITNGGEGLGDTQPLPAPVSNFNKPKEPVVNERQNAGEVQSIPESVSNADNFAGAETMVEPLIKENQRIADTQPIPQPVHNINTPIEFIANRDQNIDNVQSIPTSDRNTGNFAGAETIVEPLTNEDEDIGDSQSAPEPFNNINTRIEPVVNGDENVNGVQSIHTSISNRNNFAAAETMVESKIHEDKNIGNTQPIGNEGQNTNVVQPVSTLIRNSENFAGADTIVAPVVNRVPTIDNAQNIPVPFNNINTPIKDPAEEMPLENSPPLDSPIEEENPLLNPQTVNAAVEGVSSRNSEPIELAQDIPIDGAASEIEGIPIQSPISEPVGIVVGSNPDHTEEETDVPDDVLPPLPPPIFGMDSIDQLGKPEIEDTEMENMLPSETRYGFPAGLAIRNLQIEKVDYVPKELENEDKISEDKLQKYLKSSNLKMVDPTSDDEEKMAFQDTQILIEDEKDEYLKRKKQDKSKEVCPFEEYAKQFRCNSISRLTSKTGEKVHSKLMSDSDINVGESRLPGDVVMLPPARTENQEIRNFETLPGYNQNQGYQNDADLSRSENNKFEFAVMQPFDNANTIQKTVPLSPTKPLFDDILHPGKFSSKAMVDPAPILPNAGSDGKDDEPVDASSLMEILLPIRDAKILNDKKDEEAEESQKTEEAVLSSNAILSNILPPKGEIKSSSRDLISDSSLLDVVALGAGLAPPLTPAPLPNIEAPLPGLNPLLPATLPNTGLHPLEEKSPISGSLEKFDDEAEVVKSMLPSGKSKLAKVPPMRKPQHFYPQKVDQNIPEAVKTKNINSIPLIPPMQSLPILKSAPSTLSEVAAPSPSVGEAQAISAPESEILPPTDKETIPDLAGAPNVQETRLRYNSIPAPEDAHKIEKTKPTDGTLSDTDIWEAFLAGFSHGRITQKIGHTDATDSSVHSSEELEPHSSNFESKNWLNSDNSPVNPSAIANKKHSLTRRSTHNDVESRKNTFYSPWNLKNSVHESESSTNVDVNQRIHEIFHPEDTKKTEDEDYDYSIGSFENSLENEDKNAAKSDESVITPDDEIPEDTENLFRSRFGIGETSFKNDNNESKSKTIKATLKKDPIVDYLKAYPKENMKKPKKSYMKKNLFVDDAETKVLGVYQENSEECTKYYRRKMGKF